MNIRQTYWLPLFDGIFSVDVVTLVEQYLRKLHNYIADSSKLNLMRV